MTWTMVEVLEVLSPCFRKALSMLLSEQLTKDTPWLSSFPTSPMPMMRSPPRACPKRR
ncbi:hypothetical protein AGR7A_Lc10285 [Agrobacterium deltaense NCPPB 1641]|uniref:Uncharacterized protein n=1 Tax=Agrobacterium deltaense NCPPB 1641 TaxID=1183425 RepID=A0A1S7TTD0_9HYPH|nr:hypothetical protein AGR7A_Lc10285 [Agrobacterium deltaense NCPPB 1641]